MKKLFLTLIMLLFTLPVFALTLEGGVKQVEQVRRDVFQIKPVLVIDPTPYKMFAQKAPEGYRADNDDGSYSIALNDKSYTYDKKNKLVLIAISNKNILDFPRKLSYYEYPSGKLVSITYGTSPKDGYIFKPNGSLIGLWENGTYYEGDKVIGHTNVSYF